MTSQSILVAGTFPFGHARKTASRKQFIARALLESLERRTLLSTLVVNVLGDPASATPGQLSLREAIDQANTNPGADTVVFSPSLSGTIVLAQGELTFSDISGATTITGPGASTLSISGNNASRVFTINSRASATISGVGITGGMAATNGGGILNNGTLTLSHSTVSGNTATDAGGGIYSINALHLANCSITGNSVTGYTGYYGQTPGSGGGVFVGNGVATFSGCVISNNTASNQTGGYAGGIENKGTMTIARCTLANNSAGGGGAIENAPRATLDVTDTTLSGNTGGFGGAR